MCDSSLCMYLSWCVCLIAAICTQAERWVLNDVVGSVRLDRTRNDGRSFQAGCEDANRFTPPIVPWATHPKYPSDSPLTPGDGVERTSESHLCGVVEYVLKPTAFHC